MFVQAEVPYKDNEDYARWWALANKNGLTAERIDGHIVITGKDVSIDVVDLLRKEIQLYCPHSFFTFS